MGGCQLSAISCQKGPSSADRASAVCDGRIKGFGPLVGPEPRILILGTMPSPKSLAQQQYYSHPSNCFWHLVAEVLDESFPEEYEERVSLLIRHKIALWDVLASCKRKGSADANIGDEQANDFGDIISCNPSLLAICFNGKKAERKFRKHTGCRWELEYVALPSTSSQYRKPRAQRIEQWEVIRRFVQ